MPSVNMTANTQWRTRPASERFHTMAGLRQALNARAPVDYSSRLSDASIAAARDGSLVYTFGDYTGTLTRWAYKQLCNKLGAPPNYLSTLPEQTAAQLLNHHLNTYADADGDRIKILTRAAAASSDRSIAAILPTSYGILQDDRVLRLAERICSYAGFHNPPDRSGVGSGLYMSDRDMFIFLIDGGSLVEAGPRAALNRGVFLWNSEVGAKSFGISLFTFNVVCGNHIIHGFEDILTIRNYHTGSISVRFDRASNEAVRSVNRLSLDRWKDTVYKQTMAAQAKLLPALDEDRAKWFSNHGVTGPVINMVERKALSEEGKLETVWDAVQGVTAVARDLPHANLRVAWEKTSRSMIESAL